MDIIKLNESYKDKLSNNIIPSEPVENVQFSTQSNSFLFICSCVFGLKIIQDLSPVSNNLQQVMNIEPSTLSTAINVQILISFIFGFAINQFIDLYGVYQSLLFSNIFYTIGALVRLQIPQSNYYVQISQVLLGIAQPFTQNSITSMVKMCYPLNVRGIASSVCSLSIPIGGVVGIFFSGFFCNYIEDGVKFDYDLEQNNLYVLFYADLIIQIICTVLGAIFFKSIHLYEDSNQEIKSYDSKIFFDEMKSLMKNRNYIFQLASQGIYWGLLSVFMSQIGLLFGVFEFEQSIGNIFFGIGMFCAIISSIFCGKIVDKYKNYKQILNICYGLSVINIILIMIFAQIKFEIGFFICISLLVTLASGTKSLNFELCAEQTYPIQTGNSTGLMVNFNILFSFLIGELTTLLIGNQKHMNSETLQTNLQYFQILFSSLAIIVFISGMSIRQKLFRSQASYK